MSGDARDFNNNETQAVIKIFFFLQGKAPKEIHAILTEILGDLLEFWIFFGAMELISFRARFMTMDET
jgi:hypothetical protein